MFMRNLAAGRSAAECVKQWSGGNAVPALVARMQELPPPHHILVHILYCLSNFASTGQHAGPTLLTETITVTIIIILQTMLMIIVIILTLNILIILSTILLTIIIITIMIKALFRCAGQFLSL